MFSLKLTNLAFKCTVLLFKLEVAIIEVLIFSFKTKLRTAFELWIRAGKFGDSSDRIPPAPSILW